MMYPEGSEQEQIGLLLPVRPMDDRLRAASANWDTLAGLYRDLDAQIILSRHNSTIGPTPSDTIRLFWDLTNYLYEVAAVTLRGRHGRDGGHRCNRGSGGRRGNRRNGGRRGHRGDRGHRSDGANRRQW
jgi:hypothetical protein